MLDFTVLESAGLLCIVKDEKAVFFKEKGHHLFSRLGLSVAYKHVSIGHRHGQLE